MDQDGTARKDTPIGRGCSAPRDGTALSAAT